jgi:hypothetical protein
LVKLGIAVVEEVRRVQQTPLPAAAEGDPLYEAPTDR